MVELAVETRGAVGSIPTLTFNFDDPKDRQGRGRSMSADKCFLIMGGGGMVGYQVARQICEDLAPDKIVIASLYQREVQEAIRNLKRNVPSVTFVPFWGNVFVRSEFAREDKNRLLESPARWQASYDDLFGNMDEAVERSQLAALILEHKPDVVVDTINTATAISYQDTASVSAKAQQRVSKLQDEIPNQLYRARKLLQSLETATVTDTISREEIKDVITGLHDFLGLFKTHQAESREPSFQEIVEMLTLSQSVPQIVRHVLLLYEAMKRAGTRLYLKVGTTGTGGMGFNIPYTHSEAKPSAQLMSKTAVAFAQTGLLFLMARTPDAPITKEIKPAALIGYQRIARQTVKNRDGSPRWIYCSHQETIKQTLNLRLPKRDFEKPEKEKKRLEIVGVDTGENGFFAIGEFEAITNLKQMEFTTPEEIAEVVVLEIKGRNTGLDVIASLDASVMGPSYRAGFMRHLAIERVRDLERRINENRSVALRDLGPPELSKLLYEAHLLALEYKTLDQVCKHPGKVLAAAAERILTEDVALREQITSIGIPILLPDGKTIWRGPTIAYPEIPGESRVTVNQDVFESWVNKGWIDLRPKHFDWWRELMQRILRKREEQMSRNDEGSATFARKFYASDEIRIGDIVGWIFNNEEKGYRIIGL